MDKDDHTETSQGDENFEIGVSEADSKNKKSMNFVNYISPDFFYKEEGLLIPEQREVNGTTNVMKKMFDKTRKERAIVRKKEIMSIELV